MTALSSTPKQTDFPVHCEPSVSARSPSDTDRHRIQLVSFRVAGEEYAVDIMQVREVLQRQKIVAMAQTPDYVLGMITLRGTILPVLDLRVRFRLCPAPNYGWFAGDRETNPPACAIMVLNVANQLMGVVVDEVTQVLRCDTTQITAPPLTVAGLQKEYLLGIIVHQERIITLLDMQQLLQHEQATIAIEPTV